MMWVVIFAVIAVLGLVMVGGYAIWLAHKASDVLAEVQVLGDRAGQLGELVGQFQPPGQRARAGNVRSIANSDIE